MDFSHPWALFSGLLIGLIGMAVFIYGKKQTDLKCLGVGVVLCVFPYFVTSLLLMWGLTVACLGLLYASARSS